VYTVYFVSAEGAAGSVDLSRLLARDYWLIRWRLNEGCVGVRLSLGTGTYEWR
jgi:hypothetical protein